MSAPSLADLARLLEEATPGPWSTVLGSALIVHPIGGVDEHVAECERVDLDEDLRGRAVEYVAMMRQAEANAALIVAMRNELPSILEYVARLEAVEFLVRHRPVFDEPVYERKMEAALAALDEAEGK